MKEKVIKNDAMERLKGYFCALDDINGGQREYTTVATLISSSQDILSDIKMFSRNSNINNPKIIKKIAYDNCNGIDSFLKILLFSKPFSGLYPPLDSHKIPREILEQYKIYSIAHIGDCIDAVFSNEGVSIREKRDAELLLIQNKEQYFITISMTNKTIKILLFFYRKTFTKEDFLKLFDSLCQN
jgi:hypothetical protein